LAAVLSGIQHTTGDLTIWSDSAYVVLGAAKGWGKFMTNNQDLWGEVRESLSTREGSVTVIKVKGHATKTDVLAGRSTDRKAYMNDKADEQAGQGADRAQLPPSVTEAIQLIMTNTKMVQRRLTLIARIKFGEKRKEFVRPAKEPRCKAVPRWEQVFLARAAASDHRVLRFGPGQGQAKCII
jgi:hypothetical protein